MGFRSWLVTAVVVCATAPGCSLLVEQGGDQCASNDECAAFPGTTCIEGVCSAGECSANQECVTKNGPYHICRKSDFRCVPLLSSECQLVEGDYLNDDAFLFGSVLPVSKDDTGKSEQNAVLLGISDFETTANGLPSRPGSGGRRPLVLVGCDDESVQDTTAKAAAHLANVVGVPAIIGAAYSGLTIRMVQEVTIPAGVLVISPSATSTFITDISDNGLVWRTSPSDIYQSAALAAYVDKLLEPDIREDLMLLDSDDIKLSVFHKGDAYGSGLALAFEGDPGNVQINGASVSAAGNAGLYERVDYGDPDDPEANPENYQAAVDAALASKPHIIAIFGTTEGITDVLVPIENGWDTTGPMVTHRPRYLMADGVYSVTELFNAIDRDSDLRQRIVGSVPGTTSSLFSAFVNGYNSKFSGDQAKPETFGAAGAYDAVYLLAYAAVANASEPETGANLALGLHRMVAGDPVDVGKAKINTAFQKLSGADPIDFNGASGPLGFDVETGEAPSDVQIWCVTTDSNGDLTNAFSGVYLDSAAFVPGESPPLNGSSFGPQCKFTQ